MSKSSPTSYSPVEVSSKKLTTIEEIYDRIGGFGRFQFAAVFLLYGIKFGYAISMMLMSFAGYIPTFECITHPGPNQIAMAFNMIWTADMAAAQADVVNRTDTNVCSVNGTRCQDFSFLGSKRTVVSEWHLVCDRRWLKATITSIQMCGTVLGSILGGLSGDYFGRKKTKYGALLAHAVLNIIAAYSVTWQMFAVMRFLIGTVMGLGLVVMTPYPTEFIPLQWRHVVPSIPLWPLGIMMMALVAWLLEDWSHLHIFVAVYSAVFLLGYFYIPESPRWLATQGRVEDSYAVLEKMATANRKSLPPATMDVIKRIALTEKNSRKGKQYTYLDLFRDKRSIKLTVILSIQWVTLGLIYYGISFAVTSFVGNLYLNILLMNSIQLPNYLVTFFILDRLGRRGTCVVFMFISMAINFICVGLYVADTPVYTREVWISGLSHFASLIIVGCWVAATVWVTESYPTVIRSIGFGFVNLASRVGSGLAPLLINLDEMPLVSFILMGVLTLVSMVMILFIPETKKRALVDTMHEDIDFFSSRDSAEGSGHLAAEANGKVGDSHTSINRQWCEGSRENVCDTDTDSRTA